MGARPSAPCLPAVLAGQLNRSNPLNRLKCFPGAASAVFFHLQVLLVLVL